MSKNLILKNGPGREIHIQELFELRPQLRSKAAARLRSEFYGKAPLIGNREQGLRKERRQETGRENARKSHRENLI